mgnify:CR=1 FL=1
MLLTKSWKNCMQTLIQPFCISSLTLWENSMTYYVYILTNANKNLIYIGVTNNLIRRVYEHKHHLDKGSYTARYNIDQLVYFEETSDVEAAISREKQLKGWNRARKNRLVESKNPEWKDIYTQIL